MTYQEYELRKEYLKSQNIKKGSLDFRGQKPIEFLKLEITEEEISENSFKWKESWKKESSGWEKVKEVADWNKNFILLLGELCGVESESSRSERHREYAYLSKATVVRLQPSGHKAPISAEYEYDAEVKAKKVILKNEVKYEEYQDRVTAGEKVKDKDIVSLRYGSEKKKELLVVEMAEYGRQKADTGSHKRAIIKMLKLPSPSIELIGAVFFCFQCVPDFSNKNMRERYLSGSDSSERIFGKIEHKIKPAKVDEEPSIQFKIGEQRAILKDYKALYKLTGLVLNRGQNLDEYYSFITDYQNKSKENKVDEIVKRLTDFVEVPDNIISGDPTMKYSFVTEWGNS